MNKNLSDQQSNSSPENQKISRGLVVQQSSSFSGPLPPPEILKKFDEIVPGSAERIMKMAEGQFTHRTELEKKVIDSDIARSKWGQILGFVIALVGLIGSVTISIYGSGLVGAVIGVGTLASLVGVFMYGSQNRSKERTEKELGERK